MGRSQGIGMNFAEAMFVKKLQTKRRPLCACLHTLMCACLCVCVSMIMFCTFGPSFTYMYTIIHIV